MKSKLSSVVGNVGETGEECASCSILGFFSKIIFENSPLIFAFVLGLALNYTFVI